MTRTLILSACVLVVAMGASALFFAPDRSGGSDDATYAAPGLEPLSMARAHEDFWRLTPALLLVVYEAFAETEEDAIYDTLAGVTHGAALEYLYLERVGAMAGGGLDEADQTIHEIALQNSRVARRDDALAIAATWQVIGTVGHADHLHVRGNTYSAALTVAPVEGAWRITDFDLLEVSRVAAGEVFAAPETN